MQWYNQTRQVVLWVPKFQFFYHILLFLRLKAFTWPYLQRMLDTGDRQVYHVKSGAPNDQMFPNTVRQSSILNGVSMLKNAA